MQVASQPLSPAAAYAPLSLHQSPPHFVENIHLKRPRLFTRAIQEVYSVLGSEGGDNKGEYETVDPAAQ